jgi:hypothetical protein
LTTNHSFDKEQTETFPGNRGANEGHYASIPFTLPQRPNGEKSMKSMLTLGAIIAATVGFAAPETAQADHCYSGYGGNSGYGGYGRVGYNSGYNYAPRSYGYSAPRYSSGSRYGGSHYGHGHSYGNYSGRSYGYGNSYGRGYGGFGIGVRTRGFSFSYRR